MSSVEWDLEPGQPPKIRGDQPAPPRPEDRPPRSVPLMEGLRNLEKGYDRKFALAYCADEVWAALEALEEIAGVPEWWQGKLAKKALGHGA